MKRKDLITPWSLLSGKVECDHQELSYQGIKTVENFLIYISASHYHKGSLKEGYQASNICLIEHKL